MEFYLIFQFFILTIRRFNSQRDGILRLATLTVSTTWKSFNSQRDGILLYVKENQTEVEYSFNSQRDGILLPLKAPIPQIARRFNSQRDGILQKKTKKKSTYFSVSIPNGMEFYFFLLLGFALLI